MDGMDGMEGMDRMDIQYLDGCERGGGDRWRGIFEALGIPRFAVLLGVAWCCKGIVYNVPKFAEITYTVSSIAGPTYSVLPS